jgi:hypothetical protein
MPSSLPGGVSEWVPFLLDREWRSEMDLCRLAAGSSRSFFVDANGALLACGREDENEVGLLGLRGGPSQNFFTAQVPTPVPSMAGVRVRAGAWRGKSLHGGASRSVHLTTRLSGAIGSLPCRPSWRSSATIACVRLPWGCDTAQF